MESKNRVFIIGGTNVSALAIAAELARVEREPFVVVTRENLEQQDEEIKFLFAQMLDEVEREVQTPIKEIVLEAKKFEAPTLYNYASIESPKRGKQKKPFNKYLWKR